MTLHFLDRISKKYPALAMEKNLYRESILERQSSQPRRFFTSDRRRKPFQESVTNQLVLCWRQNTTLMAGNQSFTWGETKRTPPQIGWAAALVGAGAPLLIFPVRDEGHEGFALMPWSNDNRRGCTGGKRALIRERAQPGGRSLHDVRQRCPRFHRGQRP